MSIKNTAKKVKKIMSLKHTISEQNKRIEKNEKEIKLLKRELKLLKNRTEYRFEMIAPEEYREELLKLWYMERSGRPLDFDNLTTLDEKIQWLKLYGNQHNRAKLADKYLARDFVANTIGEEYLIPLIGVYDRAEDIDFDSLPNRYVIKANHGAKYVKIIKNNNDVDRQMLIQMLKKWLSEDFSCKNGMELHYGLIDRKIIIEEYIEDSNGCQTDYKFYCFGKDVDNAVVCVGRNTGNKHFYIFNEKWELVRTNPDGKNAPPDFSLPKPIAYEKMRNLASILSEASSEPFVRVDLYNCDGKIYFGEFTFTPSSGVDNNRGDSENIRLGQKLKLK